MTTTEPDAGVPARPGDGDDDRVELVVPAQAAYLAVLRTASAGMGARIDLDLDQIEDLRIAVDEAAALVISGAREGDRLRARFQLGSDGLEVRLSGPATTLPEPESVAWAVLGALVGEVEALAPHDGGPAGVRLVHRSRRARTAVAPAQRSRAGAGG